MKHIILITLCLLSSQSYASEPWGENQINGALIKAGATALGAYAAAYHAEEWTGKEINEHQKLATAAVAAIGSLTESIASNHSTKGNLVSLASGVYATAYGVYYLCRYATWKCFSAAHYGGCFPQFPKSE